MLVDVYMQRLQSEDDTGRERILEDVEEAFYMDGALSHDQYVTVLRLFAELTGDKSILESL